MKLSMKLVRRHVNSTLSHGNGSRAELTIHINKKEYRIVVPLYFGFTYLLWTLQLLIENSYTSNFLSFYYIFCISQRFHKQEFILMIDHWSAFLDFISKTPTIHEISITYSNIYYKRIQVFLFSIIFNYLLCCF